MAIVAGVSDNIYAIDVDEGHAVWKKHFDSTLEPPQAAAAAACCAPAV